MAKRAAYLAISVRIATLAGSGPLLDICISIDRTELPATLHNKSRFFGTRKNISVVVSQVLVSNYGRTTGLF